MKPFKRKNIKKLLANKRTREKLIAGVVEFCCKLEGHDHKEVEDVETSQHDQRVRG